MKKQAAHLEKFGRCMGGDTKSAIEKFMKLAAPTLVGSMLLSALLEYELDTGEGRAQIIAQRETFSSIGINPAKQLSKDLWEFAQLASKSKKVAGVFETVMATPALHHFGALSRSARLHRETFGGTSTRVLGNLHGSCLKLSVFLAHFMAHCLVALSVD